MNDPENPKPSMSARTTQIFYMIVLLSVTMTTANIAFSILKDADSRLTFNTIFGPILVALVAAAIQGVHTSVNSRMDTFIAKAEETQRQAIDAAREEGIKLGREQGKIVADARTDAITAAAKGVS